MHTVAPLAEKRDWKEANDREGGIGVGYWWGWLLLVGWCPQLASIPAPFSVEGFPQREVSDKASGASSLASQVVMGFKCALIVQ